MTSTLRLGFLAIALLSTLAVAAALGAQYGADMQPCPWCILQRLIFVLIALPAWAVVVWPRWGVAVVATLLALPLAAAGIASATYQNLVAAASASCNLSLAERLLSSLKLDHWLPSVFEIRASCSDAVAMVAGLPMEVWSGLLYALVALLAVVTLRRK